MQELQGSIKISVSLQNDKNKEKISKSISDGIKTSICHIKKYEGYGMLISLPPVKCR